MSVKRKKTKRPIERYLRFTYRSHSFRVLFDRVLLFGLVRRLHGRFWGITAIIVMNAGLLICFAIRPDMRHIATAFSDFGNDVRTAPYFAGTMFLSAYGLWRWRNYLNRTLKRSKPFTGLITLTILGLYLVALMPVSWKPWPYRIHFAGVIIAGMSMVLTVIVDGLLSKTKQVRHATGWRAARILSVALILGGGWLTFGSAEVVNWYQYSLLGEYMILFGYAIWVCFKTYQGEGGRTRLSKLLKNIVIID